jgi:type IV pilus assembly protein PilB
MNTQVKTESVIDILLNRGALSAAAAEKAQAEADSGQVELEKYLVSHSVVSDVDMALALAAYLGTRPIQLANFTPDEHLIESVSAETLKRHGMVPIKKTARMLTVAMADPFDVIGLDEVQAATGMELVPVVAPEKQIQEILQKHTRDSSQGLEDILRDVAEGDDIELGVAEVDDVNIDQMLESAEDAPVIRIVNSILIEALRKHASDIHIEPMEKLIRLRYRIDGVLYENPSPPKGLQSAIISRLKIMSNLDIAERRIPQDGRFKIRAMGKEVDVRVSLLPTVHGEKIVMRILDKTELAPSMSALGLEEKAYRDFMMALTQPHGMILVTGPTGSGKTTTLYSGLQELNKAGVNIITVEDPVEYQLAGINQVQVHPDVGLTFASGLRSILRQDPDIVMVGEIRDTETASIAVQAALTGHLVLSTLHTNDAAGAISRLMQMGIEPFLLASCIIMTEAQRLFRRLCSACRRERAIPHETLRANMLDATMFEGSTMYEPGGCPKCSGIGYRGRGALMEILTADEAVRELILNEASGAEIATKAIEAGMLTLRDVGMLRVKDGTTCIEEILRVTSRD